MSQELIKCAPEEQGSEIETAQGEIEVAQRLARKCGISLVPDALFLLAASKREDVRLCTSWFKDSGYWECSQYVLGYRMRAGFDIVVAPTGIGFRYLYWGPAAERRVSIVNKNRCEGLIINNIKIDKYDDLWIRAVDGGWYLRSRKDAPIVYEVLIRLPVKGYPV
jgi:hypothetical protein